MTDQAGDADEIEPMRVAARQAGTDLLEDPETYRKIVQGMTAALQSHARTEAGRFTLGVFSGLFRWILRIGLLVGFLWYVGGITAVMAWLKSGAGQN